MDFLKRLAVMISSGFAGILATHDGGAAAVISLGFCLASSFLLWHWFEEKKCTPHGK